MKLVFSKIIPGILGLRTWIQDIQPTKKKAQNNFLKLIATSPLKRGQHPKKGKEQKRSSKHQSLRFVRFLSLTLPETNIFHTRKWMVGIRSFPFGFWAYFQLQTVSFREGKKSRNPVKLRNLRTDLPQTAGDIKLGI